MRSRARRSICCRRLSSRAATATACHPKGDLRQGETGADARALAAAEGVCAAASNRNQKATLAEAISVAIGRKGMVVLVCYLDDSGKDPQNRITTIAGYAATDDQWLAFEKEVEPIFSEYSVNILHAKDLHDTDGEFEGWTILKKQ